MKKTKVVAASLLLTAVTGLTGCPQNVYGPPPDTSREETTQTEESQVEETEGSEESEEADETEETEEST